MKMTRKCRIWWPLKLLSSEESTDVLLFGWCFCHSSVSIDIVVAFVADQSSTVCQAHLKDILYYTHGKMPVGLRDSSTFALLGHCGMLHYNDGELSTILPVGHDQMEGKARDFGAAWSCGCCRLEGLLGQSQQDSLLGSNWVQLVYGSGQQYGRKYKSLPRLHHVHWNGKIVFQCDVHLITYETPTYGLHHISLNSWHSPLQTLSPGKKPKWVDELNKKKPLDDIENAVLAINCAAAANEVYEKFMYCGTASSRFLLIRRIFMFVLQLCIISVATVSTLIYAIIQFFIKLPNVGSISCLRTAIRWIFKTTQINVRIRCSEILYWPIFLWENDPRSLSSVQHAEEAAMRKHAMWSRLAVDVLLGNVIGYGLLYHAESSCTWILDFVKGFTNDILRSGCVWLMGVPAGFKLNTELAEVLGMVSLNAIQVWSSLWFYLGPFSIHILRALAILGITFGVTIPAALVIDIIVFATLHVSALHYMISLLYSQQIQILAALWRLFRGRKWNPLRGRLDSYGYAVKQHIVGSLLFTPLLLLLPTTCVFYIFFSIVNTAIRFLCMWIEIAIAIIHATPYNKIFLWMVKRSRFPSGIWVEIIICDDHGSGTPGASYDATNLPLEDRGFPEDNCRNGLIDREASSLLVSHLRSNFTSLGQIVLPDYEKIFRGFSGPSLATSAYGVLTGRRMPPRLGLGLPPVLPWMHIPYNAYWNLCRKSVISSLGDVGSH